LNSLYYVTSLAWHGNTPVHLRWFRVYENRAEPLVNVYEALVGETPHPVMQRNIDELLSHVEARALADFLQEMGHEAISIHEVKLPTTWTDLESILFWGDNHWDVSINGLGGAGYGAFTVDNI
jgi:hypothetical protein